MMILARPSPKSLGKLPDSRNECALNGVTGGVALPGRVENTFSAKVWLYEAGKSSLPKSTPRFILINIIPNSKETYDRGSS
jgi:hypothetical protein